MQGIFLPYIYIYNNGKLATIWIKTPISQLTYCTFLALSPIDAKEHTIEGE